MILFQIPAVSPFPQTGEKCQDSWDKCSVVSKKMHLWVWILFKTSTGCVQKALSAVERDNWELIVATSAQIWIINHLRTEVGSHNISPCKKNITKKVAKRNTNLIYFNSSMKLLSLTSIDTSDYQHSWCSTVAERLALVPHSKKGPEFDSQLYRTFLCGVYMLSSGAPLSLTNKNMYKLGPGLCWERDGNLSGTFLRK